MFQKLTQRPTRNILLVISLNLLFVLYGNPVLAQDHVNPGETHQFTEATWCEGTPFQDTLFKSTTSTCDLDKGQAEAAAILSISAINNDVSAYSTAFTDFYVPGSAETILDATVSAEVEWNGVLFGAGLGGAGASVEINMSLVDEATGSVKGSKTVVTEKQEGIELYGIDVGGSRVSGSKSISFPATVVRGHDHSIRLTVTCNANSGLIGADIGCIFMNNVFGLDLGERYSRWTELSITVEQDMWERFNQIDAKLLQLETKLEQMDDRLIIIDTKVDGLTDGQAEIMEFQKESIRLLLTPQGRRETDILDCDNDDCDFPRK